MDFGGPGSYESLGAEALPPLVIAWRADANEDSGVVHGDLRARFERGDPAVRASMHALAAAARGARDAVLAGDRAALGACVDASFGARSRMLRLDRRHVEMIETARKAGAHANYAGSGGSIICVCGDRTHQTEMIARLRATGCVAIVPTISQPALVSA